MTHEFHVRSDFRDRCLPDVKGFSASGKIVFENLAAAREALRIITENTDRNPSFRAEDMYAMGIIHEALHIIISQQQSEDAASERYEHLRVVLGDEQLHKIQLSFLKYFPPSEVYLGEVSPERYLQSQGSDIILRSLFILHLNNMNPGFASAETIILDAELKKQSSYGIFLREMRNVLSRQSDEEGQDLYTMLTEPFPALSRFS